MYFLSDLFTVSFCIWILFDIRYRSLSRTFGISIFLYPEGGIGYCSAAVDVASFLSMNWSRNDRLVWYYDFSSKSKPLFDCLYFVVAGAALFRLCASAGCGPMFTSAASMSSGGMKCLLEESFRSEWRCALSCPFLFKKLCETAGSRPSTLRSRRPSMNVLSLFSLCSAIF